MPVSPDIGFLLAVTGVLGIYCEFVWPGRFVPGLLGATLLALGSYSLWQNSPTTRGLLFIVLSAALFATEALIDTRFVSGVAGTLALAGGSLTLFDGPPRLDTLPACLLAAVLGFVSTFLAREAHRARANKRADIVKEP
jgi:membrane-bound ClpP family serine protease